MKKLFSLLIFIFFSCNATSGIELPNKVNISASVNVTYDKNSGLFTYAYILTNYADATQELVSIDIPLRGATILNIKSPRGWWALNTSAGNRIIWCACDEEGMINQSGSADDGRSVPSIYQIKPGQALSGFSYQSAYPPISGVFYATGWVPTPVEGIDFPTGQPPDLPAYPERAYKGTVEAPAFNEALFNGGRRPAVDGFLVFTTIKDNSIYRSPILVDILFGQNGETVHQSTFRAVLNGIDITSQFITMASNRRRVLLELAPDSTLKSGKNVLTTSVEGIVPGATRKATDTDRLVFVAQ